MNFSHTKRPAILLVLSALMCLLPASCGADDCSVRANSAKEKLMECVTAEGVRAHLVALQGIADGNNGNRAAGSPGYEASVAYVQETLEAAGYEVDFNRFRLSLVPPVILLQTAPVEATSATGTITGAGYGTVEGHVVPVDLALGQEPWPASPATSTSGCEAADYEGLDFSGPQDIALVQWGGCFFPIKAVNAQAAGAEAVILINQGDDASRMEPVAGNAKLLRNGRPSKLAIPIAGADFNTGLALSQDGAAAHVEAPMAAEIEQTSVLAKLKGENVGNVVMAGAHLDSWAAGPGISDNGTGSAALLETAVQMSRVKPSNTVLFAWWGAEEFDQAGSTAYVNALTQEQRDEIVAYLNFDMIASPNPVFYIYDGDDSDKQGYGPGADRSAGIEKLFESIYTDLDVPFQGVDIGVPTDSLPFVEAGIPAGGLFTGADGKKSSQEVTLWGGQAGQPYDPCYHLACDTVDNISLQALDVNADTMALAILQFATGSRMN